MNKNEKSMANFLISLGCVILVCTIVSILIFLYRAVGFHNEYEDELAIGMVLWAFSAGLGGFLLYGFCYALAQIILLLSSINDAMQKQLDFLENKESKDTNMYDESLPNL